MMLSAVSLQQTIKRPTQKMETTNLPMADRLLTLRKISGLEVSFYEKNGVKHFVFGPPSKNVASFCTYPKAKAFAEGVAIGREINQTP